MNMAFDAELPNRKAEEEAKATLERAMARARYEQRLREHLANQRRFGC
jgi:hypothetical protein